MSDVNAREKSPQRSRREWEDQLLQGRTAIFLVINGFAIQKPSLPIAVAAAAVSCLWILASLQSWMVIRRLVIASPKDAAQAVVDRTLGVGRVHRIFRPTTLVAVWIPALTYFAWLSFIGLVVTSWRARAAVIAALVLPFVVLLFLHGSRRRASQPDQTEKPTDALGKAAV